MRFRLLIGPCLAVLLAACSSTAPLAHDGDAAATPPDAQACAAAGGTLQALGRLQRVQCVVPYADAGKRCSTKTDCSGQCLALDEIAPGIAATGACQRDVSQNFGCRQRIDNGVTQGIICVD